MTTPTREQVVQWIQQTNVDLNTLALSEDDTHEIMYVTTLARADLEATLAEQAVELESLRKDAARWNWWKREGKVYPMRDDDNNLVICSIPITFFGGSKFSTVLEAIDADITELSQQEK